MRRVQLSPVKGCLPFLVLEEALVLLLLFIPPPHLPIYCDRDRHELSLLSLSLFWTVIAWAAGIVVVDAKDSKCGTA